MLNVYYAMSSIYTERSRIYTERSRSIDHKEMHFKTYTPY